MREQSARISAALRGPLHPARRRQEGFTLLELLVVLAILGLLIGLVGPALINQFGSAKHKVAEQAIARLVGILDIYRLDVGAYPTTEQGLPALVNRPAGVSGWNGPYVKTLDELNDPWGRPFDYRRPSQRPGHDFDIVTLGSEGKPGGEGEAATVTNR